MSLATLFTLHASPAVLAVGFSVLLVGWLLVAEEAEMRRAVPGESPKD